MVPCIPCFILALLYLSLPHCTCLFLYPLQSKSSVALRAGDECVQRLVSLWERTQLRGAHSFTMAMTQNPTLHQKVHDQDSLIHTYCYLHLPWSYALPAFSLHGRAALTLFWAYIDLLEVTMKYKPTFSCSTMFYNFCDGWPNFL